MKKSCQYIIFNYTVLVDFSDSIVQVHNDDSFGGMMKIYPRSGVRELAERIKTDYRRNFDKELKISQRSLEVEIWGHYYAEKIVRSLRDVFVQLKLRSLKRRLFEATQVFDCGEKSIDRNRWIWDIMSVFYPVMRFFIRDRTHQQ